MTFLLNLIPAPYRLLAEILLTIALVGAVWGWIEYGKHEAHDAGLKQGRAEIQAKWDAERVKLQAAVQAQKDKNLELQRQAEKNYVVQAQTRERVITQTVTEVRYATQSLAACPVPADAVRLLNDTSRCASTDSAASCGAGDPVRAPG